MVTAVHSVPYQVIAHGLRHRVIQAVFRVGLFLRKRNRLQMRLLITQHVLVVSILPVVRNAQFSFAVAAVLQLANEPDTAFRALAVTHKQPAMDLPPVGLMTKFKPRAGLSGFQTMVAR